MADRSEFRVWVLEALRSLHGTGSVLEVARLVWQVHEADLRLSGDLFYTWQYDIRWAAQYLRGTGYLHPVSGDRRAPWKLTALGWQVDLNTLGVDTDTQKEKT